MKTIFKDNKTLCFYSITPPKLDYDAEKIREVATKHCERIAALPIDALVVYDVQEEKDRNAGERPFPYIPTLAANDYVCNYLSSLTMPKVIYNCVGKQTAAEFAEWQQHTANSGNAAVFVGAASSGQTVQLSLREAYQLRKQKQPNLPLGGIVIAERHATKGDEHLRMIDKMNNGVSFFISQAVYDLDYTRNLLSDYFYHCKETNTPMVPIVFTLTPCGSAKTLGFMKWLGISIPRWLENELLHSDNVLEQSVASCLTIARELLIYAHQKQIPIGFNIESVSIRKVEIDASIALLASVVELIDNTK